MSAALPFSEIVKVRFRDTDSQGHLYFANYLVYADEVAGSYMEALGFNAMNPQDAARFIFTVNIQCDYMSECKAFDEVRVEIGYSRLGNSSADVAFELYRAHDNVQMAKGSLTQVFVDKTSRKASGLPETFRSEIINRQPELA
jgi:acyl-CoA thioester hydrolase